MRTPSGYSPSAACPPLPALSVVFRTEWDAALLWLLVMRPRASDGAEASPGGLGCCQRRPRPRPAPGRLPRDAAAAQGREERPAARVPAKLADAWTPARGAVVSPCPSRPHACLRRRPWRLPGGSRPHPRERGASGCFPPEALGLSRDAQRGGSGDQQAETMCDSVAQVLLQAVRRHLREAYISTELTERRVTRPETTRMYAFVAV